MVIEPKDTSNILSLDAVCKRLMVSETVVYRLLRSGEIRAFKIGSLWRIPESSVDAYIANQCERTQQACHAKQMI